VLDNAVCHWITLYTVHFTAFSLGGGVFSGHGVFGICSYFELPCRMDGRTDGTGTNA